MTKERAKYLFSQLNHEAYLTPEEWAEVKELEEIVLYYLDMENS